MRPPRSSSFICPGSAAPRPGAVTLAVGAATRDALARRETHAPAASKSTPKVLPSDLPTWAAATAAADSPAKGGVVVPDPDGGNTNADDGPLVDGIGSLNKRRAVTSRSSRLNPRCLRSLRQLPFDKFVAVSGTLLDRDLAIVRTWQSATRPQPTSARDPTSPLGPAACPTAGGPRSSASLAANMPSDGDPFTLTKRQPNPVTMKLSHLRVPASVLIRYRRRSKANSYSGAPSLLTRSTPSCVTRIEQ